MRILRSAIALTFLFSGCSPRIVGCPEGEVESAIEVAWELYPSDILGRMEYFCKPEPYREDVECVTWGYGSAISPGKMEAWDRYAFECVVHEAQHWYLFETNGDACKGHVEDCGWKYE